jgi:hypothetical protein
LPQLVRAGALEKPRFGGVLHWLGFGLLGHPRIGKGLVNAGGTGGHQENALQDIGDTTGAVFRMLLLYLDDALFNRRADLRFGPRVLFGQQPLRALLAVSPGPAVNRMMADTEGLA